MNADVIVVGSGASATSVAYPIVEAGLEVVMLDVGNADSHYAPLVPSAPFHEIRRGAPDQHRYFLGDDFEGVPFGEVRVGAQLTPPRRFIQKDTDELTPLETSTFARFESLATGGLAAGWGAVSVEWDDRDLAGFPIKCRDLAPSYEAVSARVGISGARDDLLPYYGNPSSLQAPLALDSNGETILASYARKKEILNKSGVFLGRGRLAALSRDLGGRQGQRYYDMDFYADKDKSVFRPAFAVEDMKRFANFKYAAPYLVLRFRELPAGEGIEVEALHVASGRIETFKARRLAIAAGTMGTARIVLRSFGHHDTPVPIVSNPYTYVPCVNFRMLGKVGLDSRHSLTQVGIVYDPPGSGPSAREEPLVHAQMYSYRSLLLFKLCKESFLPVRESLRVMRELLNSFVIIGIHHEDRPVPGKYCVLRRAPQGAPEPLEVHYALEREAVKRRNSSEKVLLRAIRKLGCWPIKRIDPGNGASIHYGGTVPMSLEERELTVTPSCLLRGTRSVYLADGSVFPYLPAKALTLSLMANADRVGRIVAAELKG
jgi:hypothetical protein